jgi:hypothetical protein
MLIKPIFDKNRLVADTSDTLTQVYCNNIIVQFLKEFEKGVRRIRAVYAGESITRILALHACASPSPQFHSSSCLHKSVNPLNFIYTFVGYYPACSGQWESTQSTHAI